MLLLKQLSCFERMARTFRTRH
uniref:Uncharacterized protein n=1 Tax=Anguilla anguilla TaxID=7936 RepID=A0A0E9SPR1_ANGAN